jgi:hypothetical protein
LRAPPETDMRARNPIRCGRPQPDWTAPCRALALALLVAAAVPLASGCGPLLFVPSPFTPQNVELIYSAQEDITIVRWRISSNDPTDGNLTFKLLEDTGYQPIDFSQSVFPGGSVPCGDGAGTCFQMVKRGPRPLAHPTDRPVQAVHDTYGVLPGAIPAVSTMATSLAIASSFHTGNDMVNVDIADAVGDDPTYPFPRTFNRSMWTTKGLCLSGSPPDDVQFSPLDATGDFPPVSPLSDEGIYCVGIRPIPQDAGDAALAQTRVSTLPQVTSMPLEYAPAVEASPIIYQIVFDLAVIPERCDAAIQNIESTIDTALQGVGVPYTKLKTMNLAVDPTGTAASPDCTQQGQRALPADAMAEAVKQAVSSYPQTYHQFQFFYLNNLDSPLPSTLTDSFQRLFDDLNQSPPPGKTLTTVSWIFTPALATTSGPGWTMTKLGWKSTDDPMLKQAVTSYAETSLPYYSQLLDSVNPIPFLSTAQAAADAGGSIKVCNASSPYQAVDTNSAESLGDGPTWPIVAADPPAFFPLIFPEVNTTADQFTKASIDMDVQVCTRYCTGHPYVSIGGAGVLSWTQSPLCATTQ